MDERDAYFRLERLFADYCACLDEGELETWPEFFIDDGVYELVKGQQTKAIGLKNFSPSYRALEGYDVEKLYVDQASLAQRGLTEKDLLVPVAVLDAQAMGQLMAQQDVILSF